MRANVASGVSTCFVTGATSGVGNELVGKLVETGWMVQAISRRNGLRGAEPRCVWRQCDLSRTGSLPGFSGRVLFHVASIRLLPNRIEEFHAKGVERIIAFSSTSRFSKLKSNSLAERTVAESLAQAEEAVENSCHRLGIAWTIFRPTLIYGSGRDRNVADIARFVHRFRMFPILGRGIGLRQPVHVADLAQACILAADCGATFNRAYDLSGGESLTYRQMVERVFLGMGKPARIVSVPAPCFQVIIGCAQLLPRYRHLQPEMAQRMDRDLCFDHRRAAEDFGFSPRPFFPDHKALGLK